MRFLSTILLASPVAAQVLQSALQQALDFTTSIDACGCDGVQKNDSVKAGVFICDNTFLGPAALPWRLPLLSLVSSYDRFGRLTPAEFLKTYRQDQYPYWRYPDSDGFQLDADKRPIKGTMKLLKGTFVDRFGDENGTWIAAADAPFSQRSLPPDALNVCKSWDLDCQAEAAKLAKESPWAYHVYEVVRDFRVVGGPIAPWFEQPGGGTQYSTGFKIVELVREGYLRPVDLHSFRLGPGSPRKCEKKPANCSCEATQ